MQIQFKLFINCYHVDIPSVPIVKILGQIIFETKKKNLENGSHRDQFENTLRAQG